ncbi:MAG TPA: WD40 repeat domain-containing protein, partial [Verrucomicrobiota bacterium]|nr:hypothetical protein [Verrucomicrobiales bacterium]HRI14802.1 WD40 repeat domain-containing protein [Verrucomicrobiota bacterium]
TSFVGVLGFLPDSRRLVLGDPTGLTVFDLVSGAVSSLYSMPPHEWVNEFLNALAYSPDGRWMVCHLGDGLMRLFDLANGGEPESLPSRDATFTLGAAFSPDGKLVVGAGQSGIAVWDVASRKLLQTLPASNYSWVASPVFSPDGRLLATVTADQRVQFWDTGTWAEVVTLRGHEFEIWAALYTPDGSWLITASRDGSIRVWPGTGPTRPDEWSPPEKVAGALADDATVALFVHTDRHWELDDVAGGKRLATGGPVAPGHPPNVAVSTGGRWIAFGTAESLQVFSPGEGHVHQWQLTEGPNTSTAGQNILTFSPDGHAVLFANSVGALRRLDLATGSVETLFEPNGRPVLSVACSLNGRRVAAGYGDRLIQWLDLVSGEHHDLPPAHIDDVSYLAFSPDGQFLASTGPDVGVRLWDLQNGTQRAVLTGPITAFWSVAFSPDGRRLAAGGSEGQVSVWDVQELVPLEVLNLHANRDPNVKRGVNWLTFRADQSLVTFNGDSIRLWPAPSLADIDQARKAK